jgi:hypothetical protein
VVGVADELTKLASLRDAGLITPEEFQRQRDLLLPPGPPASPPGLTAYNQALPNHECGRCGKPLSTFWKGKCEHCGASYAEFAPLPRTA